ncbi:MAG: rhomboid family intramembrane serine protease [Bacteroidota bacterium]
MSGRWREPRPFALGGPLTPAVKALLIANVAVFLFQMLARTLAQVSLERLFGLVPYEVTHHLFLWQLVTYMFLHGGLMHIGFNMLALWMFGTELEYLWGTNRFTRFYFITGIGAAICSTLVQWNSLIPTIGASGAIYGLLAAYGLLFPDRIILLFFIIPIQAKYMMILYGLMEFYMAVTASGTGVAHVAHLGGMLFGWLYIRHGWGDRRLSFRLPSFRAWRERRRQRQLRKKFKVYYKETRGRDEENEENEE